MITLGTGVGGGVILDGVVLTGCAYGGAELGPRTESLPTLELTFSLAR